MELLPGNDMETNILLLIYNIRTKYFTFVIHHEQGIYNQYNKIDLFFCQITTILYL